MQTDVEQLNVAEYPDPTSNFSSDLDIYRGLVAGLLHHLNRAAEIAIYVD